MDLSKIKTIYETRGAAKEYCDYAIDVYTGCPHNCKYCYASAKAKRNNRDFLDVKVRPHIFEATKEYLENHPELHEKMIFLGFESDPFPYKHDCSATIDMIKLLKSFGCHIMFCTKGIVPSEAIDLLDENDSVGITITCGDEMSGIYEPNSVESSRRLINLVTAKKCNAETWISIEPVLEPNAIYDLLESSDMRYVDKIKLGKLNHMNISDLTGNSSDTIDWYEYGTKAIEICKKNNIYYIVKKALADILNKGDNNNAE